MASQLALGGVHTTPRNSNTVLLVAMLIGALTAAASIAYFIN